MRLKRLWRGVLVLSLVAAAGVALVSVAGASRLAVPTTAAPESTVIDPLSLRSEATADRSLSELHGKSRKHNGVVAPVVSPTAFSSVSNAVSGQSFEGVSMWDQRTLNGFYLEPPDQGMCVSTDASVGTGGRVVETVNDVVAVYNTSGTGLKEQTLNQFFGYPDLLLGGPELTDPSCYYDSQTGAWIVVVLTLELGNQGHFTGQNHLDIAVSNPANHDPSTTTWKTYTIDTTDNGNNGSPNHHCAPDPNPKPDESMPDACVGDYPHIGRVQERADLRAVEAEARGERGVGTVGPVLEHEAREGSAGSGRVHDLAVSGPRNALRRGQQRHGVLPELRRCRGVREHHGLIRHDRALGDHELEVARH